VTATVPYSSAKRREGIPALGRSGQTGKKKRGGGGGKKKNWGKEKPRSPQSLFKKKKGEIPEKKKRGEKGGKGLILGGIALLFILFHSSRRKGGKRKGVPSPCYTLFLVRKGSFTGGEGRGRETHCLPSVSSPYPFHFLLFYRNVSEREKKKKGG